MTLWVFSLLFFLFLFFFFSFSPDTSFTCISFVIFSCLIIIVQVSHGTSPPCSEAPLEEAELTTFAWRRLLHRVLVRRLPMFQISVRCSDVDKWYANYRMLIGVAMIQSSKDNAFCLGDLNAHAALHDGALRSRYQSIHAYVEKITHKFNETWTPQSFLFSSRSLLVLNCHEGSPLCPPIFYPSYSAGQEASMESVLRLGVAAGGNARQIKQISRLLWIEYFHENMRGLQYSNPVHCLDALARVPHELPTIPKFVDLAYLESGQMSASSPVEWLAKQTARSNQRSCSNPACDKPRDQVDSFKTCSHCESARYCSESCQKQHWPTHKKLCREWPTKYARK